jgi:hypothetical protein
VTLSKVRCDTFSCTTHASQEIKMGPHTLDSFLTFSKNNLQKQIGHFNSYRKNTKFKKKKRLKQSLGSEVISILKSTKFQCFSGNDCMIFKVSSKLHLNIIHYKNRKWIYVDISLVHLLYHFHAYISIFNKIFDKNKIAQL